MCGLYAIVLRICCGILRICFSDVFSTFANYCEICATVWLLSPQSDIHTHKMITTMCIHHHRGLAKTVHGFTVDFCRENSGECLSRFRVVCGFGHRPAGGLVEDRRGGVLLEQLLQARKAREEAKGAWRARCVERITPRRPQHSTQSSARYSPRISP